LQHALDPTRPVALTLPSANWAAAAAAPTPIRPVRLAAGYTHSLAVAPDGTVWAWGRDGSARISGTASNDVWVSWIADADTDGGHIMVSHYDGSAWSTPVAVAAAAGITNYDLYCDTQTGSLVLHQISEKLIHNQFQRGQQR